LAGREAMWNYINRSPLIMTTWPTLTREDVIAFQFSSWYHNYSSLSIRSTVVPLDNDFRLYLEADGIFVPIGSEDVYVR
jgi:hypothetical protein